MGRGRRPSEHQRQTSHRPREHRTDLPVSAAAAAAAAAMFSPTLIAVFLLAAAHSALGNSGFECYECGSTDQQCLDPVFNPGHLGSQVCANVQLLGRFGQGDQAGSQAPHLGGHSDAQSQHQAAPQARPSTSPVCYKLVFKPDQHNKHQYPVERGCGILGYKESCKHLTKEAEKQGLKVEGCYECKNSLCNGATRGTSMALPLLLVPVLVLARVFLR